MRRLFLTMIVSTLTMASVVASTPAALWSLPLIPGTDPVDYSATIEKMKALKIDVRWEDGVDIAEVIKDLNIKSKRADPKHVGIKFKLSLLAETEKPDSHGLVIHRKVNILLEDSSIYEILEYVDQQTNLEVRIGKNVVVLQSPNE